MNINASTSAGALLGGDIGTLIIKCLRYFWNIPVDDEAAGAIVSVCIFLACHLIPDPTSAGPLPAKGAK